MTSGARTRGPPLRRQIPGGGGHITSGGAHARSPEQSTFLSEFLSTTRQAYFKFSLGKGSGPKTGYHRKRCSLAETVK